MRVFYKITLFSLALSTLSSLHADTFAADCITINHDFSAMLNAKEQASFRFSSPSNTTAFSYNAQAPYSEYISASKAYIKARNPQASRPCPIMTPVTAIEASSTQKRIVADLIAPFELRQANNNKAILLIHGLTDSPYLFHDLAGYFFEQGFNVRTLLLPGHGTAPADLIDVTYQQWQQAAAYGINRTLADFEQVYLGGFSTGGALIFDHLMQQQTVSDKIKGLLMWSPASQAKSQQAWLAKYVAKIPFVDWLDKDADSDFAKYESFSFNAAGQVNSLMQRLDVTPPTHLIGHDIPLLLIASEADQTINTNASLALANFWHKTSGRKTANKDEVIYYGQAKNAKKTLNDTIKLTVPQCDETSLCAAVKDIAHTSPTNSPQNAHYGVQGQYRNCGHYLSDDKQYKACKTNAQVNVGEVTKDNIERFSPIKRLTYNPYYEQMLKSIGDFLH